MVQTRIPRNYLAGVPQQSMCSFIHRLQLSKFREFQTSQNHRGYNHQAQKAGEFWWHKHWKLKTQKAGEFWRHKNWKQKAQKVGDFQRPGVCISSPPNPKSRLRQTHRQFPFQFLILQITFNFWLKLQPRTNSQHREII